jgi:hypothetical protein
MLSCCLVLPKFYILGLLLTLGIPWYTNDYFSSGIDVLESLMLIPLQSPIKISNAARLQRRLYRCHTKFKPPPSRTLKPRNGQRKKKKKAALCEWASMPDLIPHIQPLLKCFQNPPDVAVSHAKVFEVLWVEANWERVLQEFLLTHDPSRIMDSYNIISQTDNQEGSVTVPLQAALISSIEYPYCLSSTTIRSSKIIDSGTSVCISPHKSDFITYKDSKMKIKDLSLLNQVAGEGIISWSLQDENSDSVQIELKGYHIPDAEVCLLSPQVLLKTIGGHALQTVDKIDIALENGISLCAQFCPQSNLPMIPLGLENNKLLLWHQRLSHASVKWVQKLMRDRKWLPGTADNKTALHSGPFIPTKKGSRAQLCDTSTLKCTACLYAKASTRSPENFAPKPSFKKQVLKQDHLKPGNCISANHYFSPIIGQIQHTFGKERSSYTCGSLFVDHTSGKIFNFPQYSTNAFETIQNILRLEVLAMEEGFKVKEYHSANGIFS